MANTKIQGVEGMYTYQVQFELESGGRFVVFQYCVSVIFITFKRSSPIYFIRAGQNPLGKGIGFTLLTLVAGWWGFPWGPIYSAQSIYRNLPGGKNATKEVAAALTTPKTPMAARPVATARPV